MIKAIVAILFLGMFIFGYNVGYFQANNEQENSLKEFWGHYYNVDERGCYNCVKEAQ